ncbi:hypothetical protein HPB48_009407 [Haemaphysalis longicornis]|uniref:Thioredoxin domain-containing protein n=1 Tax=Haemaphysalis longicornis TaxID=44386 RepID=A0A9J6FDQ9_HAELO|nr:hypothetical protein HPB48_009407 [Haemaphysalis longicornis]
MEESRVRSHRSLWNEDFLWGILFSHPADYTPVCTTELARAAQLAHVFAQKGVKIIALSCDSVDSHHGWIKDIEAFGELPDGPFPYPIIADEKREIAVKLGMLDPVEKDKEGLPLTCRAVFIIGPDKKMKLSMLYPATTGRNFEGYGMTNARWSVGHVGLDVEAPPKGTARWPARRYDPTLLDWA